MPPVLERIKIGGFCIIIGGLIYLQLIKGDYFYQRSYSNYIRLIPLPSLRGMIYDRKSRPLIKNKLEFEISIFAHRKEEGLFSRIAYILKVPEETLRKNFEKNYIAPFLPAPVYVTSDRDKVLKLEEENFSSVVVRTKARRELIEPYLFSHIIGYLRMLSPRQLYLRNYGYSLQEEIGSVGVEFSYDEYLRGKDGGRQVEVDAQARIVNILSQKEPQRGKDIYLTIDREIQRVAYQALSGYRGCLILMDPHTGKIFALVNRPSFNANRFITQKGYFLKVSTSKSKPLLNRAIQSAYPPGSVFKMVVGLAGLEEKEITPRTRFLCKGVFTFQNHTYRCWNVHYWQNLEEALFHSCNIFFYNLGLRLGVKKILKYAQLLELGRPSGIDLPYEDGGLIGGPGWKREKRAQRWYKGDTINLSIGQGYILVTPIQIARVVSFFANGGFLVQPYLVERIDNLPLQIKKKEKVAVSEVNLRIINKGLHQAVKNKEGTAHILERLGLELSGKTGTAQVEGKSPHGWFAGFFPFSHPRYVIVVFTENSGSSFEACKVAYKFLKKLKEKNLLDLERVYP